MLIRLICCALLHPLAASAAGLNIFAEPCRRATIAAIACCSSFRCDPAEVVAHAGNILNGGAPTKAQASGLDASRRLADLLKTSPTVQAGMAQLCRQRAGTCVKQCGNAAKTGSADDVASSTMNEDTCARAKERGDKLVKTAAAALSAEEDERANQASDRVLSASAQLSTAPVPAPSPTPTGGSSATSR
jgi:hypothetical protein